MKKENIVKKNWEFQQIINCKKQIINKYLILYYMQNKQQRFEIGISIPKKFASAVKRNFLKRQIKAIIDNNNIIDKINHKILLIVRKEFINLSFNEKKEHVNKMINNLNKNLRKY